MKTMKFVILFCLACSTAFLIFDLYAEGGWLKTQKSALAVSSTSTRAKIIQNEFALADSNGKTKIFDDFVKHIQNRDQSISNSINSSFEMTQWAANAVFTFNALAAICVVYLLIKKQTRCREKPE